jgi:carbonic anhydrase
MNIKTGLHLFNMADLGSRELFGGHLLRRARRRALFITCSEMFLKPLLINQEFWRHKHVIQNPGNLVAGEADDACMSATIALALAQGVQDIVVCGHFPCSVVSGAHGADAGACDSLALWLENLSGTRHVLATHYSELVGEDRQRVAVKENVLVQLEKLITYPAVAARLKEGALHLHGWVHSTRTGHVVSYEPTDRQFVQLLRLPPSA